MSIDDKGLGSTSMFEVVSILKDDGEFAIAQGLWNGEKHISYACRWHAQGKSCGYPQTFGKPQWMLLPAKSVRTFFERGSDGHLEGKVAIEF